MSIINQTLRDLDARKAESEPPQLATPAVSTLPRPRRGLWIAGAVLLLIAGLAVWFGLKPAPVAQPVQNEAALAAIAPPVAVEPAPIIPQVERPTVDPVPPMVSAQPKTVDVPPQLALDKGSPKFLNVEPNRKPLVESGSEAKNSDPKPLRVPAASAAKDPAITKEVKKSSPEEDAEDRYRKALNLVNKGRENQARPLLEEAIRLSPAHVAARQVLATLLNEAGLNREAEVVLREGRAVSPDNAWFALSLARLQAARGDLDGAAAIMKTGIDGKGVNGEYHATYAALLSRLKKPSDAAHQYELALKLQPDQGTWWMGLGLAMAAQGKTDEARAAYGRALAAGNLSEKLEEFVRAKLGE